MKKFLCLEAFGIRLESGFFRIELVDFSSRRTSFL